MTDEPNANPTPDPEPDTASAAPPTEPSGPSASEAWADVVARMGELSDAVSAWAKSATDNPENRRRLDDVRRGVDDMASKADSAFAHVTSTEFGQQVRSGAEEAGQAIGDAAQKVSDAAAPHVASAFAGLAGVFGRAAQKVEEAAARQTHTAAPAADAAPAEGAAPAPADDSEPISPDSAE